MKYDTLIQKSIIAGMLILTTSGVSSAFLSSSLLVPAVHAEGYDDEEGGSGSEPYVDEPSQPTDGTDMPKEPTSGSDGEDVEDPDY